MSARSIQCTKGGRPTPLFLAQLWDWRRAEIKLQLFQKSFSKDTWPSLQLTADEILVLHQAGPNVNVYETQAAQKGMCILTFVNAHAPQHLAKPLGRRNATYSHQSRQRSAKLCYRVYQEIEPKGSWRVFSQSWPSCTTPSRIRARSKRNSRLHRALAARRPRQVKFATSAVL